MKIAIISSAGGHLTEVRCLQSVYSQYEHFYVLNHSAILPEDMKGRTYFITHSERDMKFFLNLFEAFRIMKKERPDIVLSTGAGPAVPFAIIGKLFFRTKIVFIETITRISKPSLTGKIMYRLSDHFYYQWEMLKPHFPKGTYGGTVL